MEEALSMHTLRFAVALALLGWLAGPAQAQEGRPESTPEDRARRQAA